MGTRERLNISFISGSLTIAALLGLWADSCGVFVIAAVVLLILNLVNNDIR